MLNDYNLLNYFSKDEINLIADEVENHIASMAKESRNIYGMIICDRDKNVNLKDMLIRTHLSIKKSTLI